MLGRQNDQKNLLPDIISSTKAKINSYVLPKINTSKDVKLIEKKIGKIKIRYIERNNLDVLKTHGLFFYYKFLELQ